MSDPIRDFFAGVRDRLREDGRSPDSFTKADVGRVFRYHNHAAEHPDPSKPAWWLVRVREDLTLEEVPPDEARRIEDEAWERWRASRSGRTTSHDE